MGRAIQHTRDHRVRLGEAASMLEQIRLGYAFELSSDDTNVRPK